MEQSPVKPLPDELLEAIVFYLPADATLAFGQTCKRNNKIAFEHFVWRRHCIQGWKYWESRHEMQEKLQLPPAQRKWRHLYNERRKIDKQALEIFNDMLEVQQLRIQRIEDIAKFGYDVKDLLLDLKDNTPGNAPDVLARRYYANVVLGQLHRRTAIEKWSRVHNRQMVRLEEVMGAFDLFVLGGGRGDLNDMDQELNRIAEEIRSGDQDFDEFSTRRKAMEVAKYLREHNLVGNPIQEDYHALRNNFISIALFDDLHTSLPLQSVAIYCSVARRLGVDAKPSNYPAHVHAVIQAPADMTLDGRQKAFVSSDDIETMHMDPWRSSNEVREEELTLRLSQMGVPPARYAFSLGGASNFDIAIRTARNIMTSVQEMRDRQRGASNRSSYPDIEAAWYGMLWSMMILGETNPAATLHRRRQCLPYLAEHFQTHFPEDLGMLETVVAPMFHNEREFTVLLHVITEARKADQNAKAPYRRSQDKHVEYKIGQHFQHRRYGYTGIVIGWDFKCEATAQWVHQMRVDDLPRGQAQPFYNVM